MKNELFRNMLKARKYDDKEIDAYFNIAAIRFEQDSFDVDNFENYDEAINDFEMFHYMISSYISSSKIFFA